MREDVSFRSSDNVTLRGWFYKPSNSTAPLPCLVMSHGFSSLKEMALDAFAEYFSSTLPMSCLVYDNRGFGESDSAFGQPRQEIIPALQISDYSDAITYAQSRSDVNKDRIGIWGSSYSGGHVLWVGAADRRVKVVLSQVPLVNGWENFRRMIRPDFIAGLNQRFEDGEPMFSVCTDGAFANDARVDRWDRANGSPAGLIPVVDDDVHKPSALPSLESYNFFTSWAKKSAWKNEVTVKSYV